MIPGPLVWKWDADTLAMRPLSSYFAREAARRYEANATYALDETHTRSKKSHDHYFVLVDEIFDNLPEREAGRWATADHMRRWALIKAGYHHHDEFVCANKAEAPRLAAFLRQIDEYAVIVVTDAVVTRYTAKSQNYKAMGRADFQASKDAVLAILSGLIGVSPSQLHPSSRSQSPNKRAESAASQGGRRKAAVEA